MKTLERQVREEISRRESTQKVQLSREFAGLVLRDLLGALAGVAAGIRDLGWRSSVRRGRRTLSSSNTELVVQTGFLTVANVGVLSLTDARVTTDGQVVIRMETNRALNPAVGDWSGLQIVDPEYDSPAEIYCDGQTRRVVLQPSKGTWEGAPGAPRGPGGLHSDRAQEIIWRLLQAHFGLVRSETEQEGD